MLGAPSELFGNGGFRNLDTFGKNDLINFRDIRSEIQQSEGLNSIEKAETYRLNVPIYHPEDNTHINLQLETVDSDDTYRMPTRIKEDTNILLQSDPKRPKDPTESESTLRKELENLR
jgi:hypothetical protein